MNAVLSLSHFCETHGPSILFSTQAYHFAGEDSSGVLEPSGIQFFGSLKKLKDYNEGTPQNGSDIACEACESINGFITNDFQNKISFLSTRLPIDSNVSYLLKQAAIRSLSCEVVPGREGQIYFGDSVCGHVLSNTFFLKDAQARGFHRWYSILVFMKDKHFLLNSWPFFQQHVNQIVLHLQRQALQVCSNEQNAHSQRAFRLSSFDQRHSSARSLAKLTASTKVFTQLHQWFTWLLSTAAKRLEEHLPSQMLDCEAMEALPPSFLLSRPKTSLQGSQPWQSFLSANVSTGWIPDPKEIHISTKQGGLNQKMNKALVESKEEDINQLRKLRHTFGAHNFQRVLYSALIGQQVVVRGPKVIAENVINLLQLFLPSRKVRCQKYGDTYRTPDVCNIVGLDLCAAVPMSSDSIMRLDIVPFQQIDCTTNQNGEYAFYKFIIKNEKYLPEKLPSLLVKIEKALSDESLTDRVVWLRIKCLMEQWFHVAEVMREVKKKRGELHSLTGLLQSLGVQDQDSQLLDFWTS